MYFALLSALTQTNPTINVMPRLRDVFYKVRGCHQYANIEHGNTRLQIAWRSSEIVSAIRAFVRTRCSQHSRLSERELIDAIGKDLIAMGLIRIVLPEPKS